MPRLFITIVLIFGTVAVGLFYLAPEWQAFRLLREDSSNLAGISAELDSLIQNRDVLLSLINSVSKDNLQRINQALPAGVNASEFLVTLERLSRKNGLALRRVDLVSSAAQLPLRPGQPKPAGAPTVSTKSGGINEFPVGMSLSGTYESFKAFLGELEKNLRLIDVQEITFTSPEKPSAFDISIKAKTYYQ